VVLATHIFFRAVIDKTEIVFLAKIAVGVVAVAADRKSVV
jgi:hypothetical protein